VSDSPEQIRKHIEVLSTFEQKYGEFLAAVHDQWAGNGARWTPDVFAERKREIQMLATRADLAMKASGVGQFYITHPPAMGGGIKSTDLPSQVFDFDPGFMDDGMEIQRQILDRIPSQIVGLEMRAEEAEAKVRQPVKLPRPPSLGFGWINHPWVIGIGVTVIGGGILAAILALVN
jgi:hypothetical protein